MSLAQVRNRALGMIKIITSTGEEILIDDSDLELASQYRWHADRRPTVTYAKANLGKGKTIYLHRLLFPHVPRVDHKDGNGLNCQRHNLRPATSSQNLQNKRKERGGSSRFKGVSRLSNTQKWQVHIRLKGKSTYLGSFTSEIEAAKAYDTAAKINFGEFALVNFKDTEESFTEEPSKVIRTPDRTPWKEVLISTLKDRGVMTSFEISEIVGCDPKHMTSRVEGAGITVRPVGYATGYASGRRKLYVLHGVGL